MPRKSVESKRPAVNQPPFLIIDGYNLFHAAGLARSQYATGELHRQRERLLKLVGAGLSTLERQQTTIVFDAPVSQSGFERAVEFEGIAVLFSQPGFEADDVIESLIDRHPAVRRLVVVSNDRRLQMSARSRRASCLDCEAFLKRLTRQSQPDSAA
ncbi:MAG: hypothetical protein FJ267_04245, partial [Planctomycetes bacterium]|nr:hypothetical protein [Planctomycetota bacterium]